MENRSCQDGGVDIKWGENHDKVQGFVIPGTVRDKQRLKDISRSLSRSLVLHTDEHGDVKNHGRPPKALSHKGQGPTRARVAGKPGGVGPLQDQGADRVRNKHPVIWAPPWVRLGTLHLTNLLSYPPAECHRQARGGKDGLRFRCCSRGAIAAQQHIRLDILGSRSI